MIIIKREKKIYIKEQHKGTTQRIRKTDKMDNSGEAITLSIFRHRFLAVRENALRNRLHVDNGKILYGGLSASGPPFKQLFILSSSGF